MSFSNTPFVGLLFLLSCFLVSEQTAVFAILFFGLLVGSASSVLAAQSVSEYSNTKEGIRAYQNEEYEIAARHFGKAQAENPDSDEQHLNLGDALLKSGSYEGAIKEFEALAKSQNPVTAAKGGYNLGKTYEAMKNSEQAIRSYQAALEKIQSEKKVEEKNNFEVQQRIKRALEKVVQQQKQKPQEGDSDKNKEGEEKKKSEGEQKSSDKGSRQVIQKKPKFKAEKISEQDAKRILQQLSENEKNAKQRMMQSKTEKPQEEVGGKDW